MDQVVFVGSSVNRVENAVSFAVGESFTVLAEQVTWAWPFSIEILVAFGDVAGGATGAPASASRYDVNDNSHRSYLFFCGRGSCLIIPSIATCVYVRPPLLLPASLRSSGGPLNFSRSVGVKIRK